MSAESKNLQVLKQARAMSYSLNSLKGYCGTTIGVIKGDTRSLDYGSNDLRGQRIDADSKMLKKTLSERWGTLWNHAGFFCGRVLVKASYFGAHRTSSSSLCEIGLVMRGLYHDCQGFAGSVNCQPGLELQH